MKSKIINRAKKTLSTELKELQGLSKIFNDNEDKSIMINQVIGTKTIDIGESLSLFEQEKILIEKSLLKHKGKRKNAAAELGISERTLYRKLKELELE